MAQVVKMEWEEEPLTMLMLRLDLLFPHKMESQLIAILATILLILPRTIVINVESLLKDMLTKEWTFQITSDVQNCQKVNSDL